MKLLPHILQCHPIMKTDFIKAEDTYLFDRDGRRFVDFESGIWVTGLGHNHPRIKRCTKDQLDKVVNLAPQHTPSIAEEAALQLLSHTPFEDGKVVFLSSGSEAVELSIRFALLNTQKSQLLAFNKSYLGAFGLAGKNPEGNCWTQVDIDACLKCPEDECALSCSHLVHIEPDKIAAFVLDPILASGGIIVPPQKVVDLLGKKIRSCGGLMVVDEVTTGLGRTGTWLGIEHFNVPPDIIAFGKTLGNGYPISAVAMRRSIGSELEEKGFHYIQSHQNDPLGCVIAREVLSVLDEDELISRSRSAGEFLRKCLQQIKSDLPIVSDVRGKGLMMGMELDKDSVSEPEVFEVIDRKMCDRGYIIGVKPEKYLLRFMPPFTISENQISGMCENLSEVLSEI